MTDTSKGGMTVAEAGRKGGETTSDRYGHEFYVEIGRKGGSKGGATTSARYGKEHYVKAGRKGGQRMKQLAEARKKALEGNDAATY